ncbi:toxin-antitoxin system YwqK family antitoxin [Fusobacterium massiliense]|uniref:toxin-antitoxin system YwqK family antitoxin n=1 Tax=Fusobacterium massiliense TaxID=1852365 RepID=UPI0028D11D24|nr:toxin-antitoxin system YwqK family antitoxin [Fusobacterium massiliense]
MKKIFILFFMLFLVACKNVEQTKNNTFKKVDNMLYVNDVPANGEYEYTENGIQIRGNYQNGLPDGKQERLVKNVLLREYSIKSNKLDGKDILYYNNGKILSQTIYADGKILSGKRFYKDGILQAESKGKDISIFYKNGNKMLILEKTFIGVYNENGEEVVSVSPKGIKYKGQPERTSFLQLFASKDKISKAVLLSLGMEGVQSYYKNGNKAIDIQGLNIVVYYENGKEMLHTSISLDASVDMKVYYENGNLSEVSEIKNGLITAKFYDENSNLISETIRDKNHTIKEKF